MGIWDDGSQSQWVNKPGHQQIGHQANDWLSQWVTEPIGQGYNVYFDFHFFVNRVFFDYFMKVRLLWFYCSIIVHCSILNQLSGVHRCYSCWFYNYLFLLLVLIVLQYWRKQVKLVFLFWFVLDSLQSTVQLCIFT